MPIATRRKGAYCSLLLLAACASPVRLECPERFYLSVPTERCYSLERRLPGGSVLNGELRFSIRKVADGSGGEWSMRGELGLSVRGSIVSREDVEWAPRSLVQAAMEPDNVSEVFEELSSEGGVTMTRVHWDRLRSLRLPIEVERAATARAFSSSLRSEAMADAAEVALVWHKTLAPTLGLPPFGTYSARDVREQEQLLELLLVQDVPGGERHEYRYRFARDMGLVGIDAQLPDGEHLRIATVQ